MNEPVVVALDGWTLAGLGILAGLVLAAVLSMAAAGVRELLDRLHAVAVARRDRRAFAEGLRTGSGRAAPIGPGAQFRPLGPGEPYGVIELPAGMSMEDAVTFAAKFDRARRTARRPRSMPSVAARRARRVHPR